MTLQKRPWRDRAVALILAGSMTFSLVPSQALAEALAEATPQAEPIASEQVVQVSDENSAAVDEAVQTAEPATQAAALSSNAKVYIQESKDYRYSSSNKSGALQPGETLWANVFDGSYSYSLSVVPNPGTWTYTWLAGTAASTDASDYAEVVGREQSLTVTDALAGKYLICKVSADGVDLYGPGVSSGSGINRNYIPGPVLKAGQASLYSVKLGNSSPAVGDTLSATAYTSYSTPAPEGTQVSYSWFTSTSSYGTWTKVEGESGPSLKLTADYAGKYVKVVATAGVNDVEAKTSEAVLPEGAVKLGGVELKSDRTAAEIGATLTASAYAGSSYSPTYVDASKVTYTWKKYKGSSNPSYSTTWETIQGATGPTLTVTDDLEGCYISVSAKAGANEVSLGYSSALGPFKLAGAVDISAVSIVKQGTTSSVFTVGDVAQARAREVGAASGVFVDASKLDYQWLSCDTKSGTYAPIDGATGETLELTSELQGRYIKCRVSSKVGSSMLENSRGSLVAAAGSVNVTKAQLDASSKAEAGKTLTATAVSSDKDVTADVAWSWYYGDSSSTCDTRIEGAATNTFTPDAATYAGKYVQAHANGGFGDEKTNAVAIVEAGSVELYGVEVTGAQSNGAVHVGSALTARATKGNSYTYVTSTDTVHYRWQYSLTKSTADANFMDIPGVADSATYVPTENLAGAYIRVIATSENSVKSTQKKSYYGSTTSVDPVGPVMLAGQYVLASVAPAEASKATLTAGTTLTPSVRIPGSSSYSDEPLPSDAKLSIAWYAKGADDADWAPVTGGVDSQTGAIVLSEGLIGKRLKLTASALSNEVQWTSAGSVTATGEYDLLRVITTPQINSSSTHLVAGDAVKASAQAKRVDGSSTNGIDVTDDVAIAWYAADSANAAPGDWSLLDGVSGSSIQVPDAAAGKYLKAVATSGSSTAELVSANPVIAAGSLKAAVQKLSDANATLSVAYSDQGGNINDVLKAQLEKLGFSDVDVRVTNVSFSMTNDKATVGISSADDATNGDVRFFFMDPNDYSGYNLDGLRRATVTFELSREGEEPVAYAPSKSVQVAWDEEKLQDLLDDAAEKLAIGYATGDSADSVTGSLTLPYKAGSKNKFSVAWESSDTQVVSIGGYGWEDYTGKVTRRSSDAKVSLTAKVTVPSNVSSDLDLEGTAAHVVTVKGDQQKVAAEKAALEAKVEAGFTYANVTYSSTSDVADRDGLTADLQMPRTSTLGIDGKYYKVSYTASTNDVTFNGYAGTVYRPKPGDAPASTSITLTVADKTNDEVTASKTLDYVIAPQDDADLKAELALMQKAKDGFAQAILNGQDADDVTGNMHAFQKAYLDANGSLAWTYDKTATDAAPAGIVPVDLPGYDPMGSAGWRLFKSSNASVVNHENLLVSQPALGTHVTITARLASEKYARYAERYPDDETYAQLAGQQVSATVKVTGTTGADDPNDGKDITVSAKVTGPDASGNEVDWVGRTEVTIPAGESWNAAELTKKVLEQNGMTCDDGMYTISAKDGGLLPNGQASLGSAKDASGNWRWWVLYINGQMANVMATNYYVKAGDVITWTFGDGTVAVLPHTVSFETGEGSSVAPQAVADGSKATRPDDPTREGYIFAGWYADEALTSPYDFNASVTADLTLHARWLRGTHVVNGVVVDPSAEGPEWDSDWSGFTSADKVTDAPVPTADAEAKWVEKLKEASDWSVYLSDPVLVGDYLYVAAGSKLYKKNVDTGATVEGGEAALVAAIDSTSRITYADGLILVPLSGGRLQALTVDSLTTKWVTDELPRGAQGAQQAISSLTVSDGFAYFGTADADWSSSYGGYLACVRLSDGALVWSSANANSAGYYWSGLAVANGFGVVGDDSGTVSVIDLKTGSVVSSLKVADRIRSSVVMDGTTAYVASNDGVLHKLVLAEDGTLSEVAKVSFGFSSTSTPVLVSGKIVVGGTSDEFFEGGYQNRYQYHYGQLAVIDAASMTVEHSVCRADGNYIRQYGYDAGGDVKSQPVVSVQDGQTYVYFTSNCEPGCIYRYRAGDNEAEVLYTPEAGDQNYCMASISVGSDGALYYTNDSGKLFAVRGNGQRLTRYTVSFDAGEDAAQAIASQRVKKGHAATEPTAPKRFGYRFLGWYTADGAKWDFSQPVTGDMTLFAKWESATPVPGPVEPTEPTTPAEPGVGNGGGSGAAGGNGSVTPAAPKASIALSPAADATPAATEQPEGQKGAEPASADAEPADDMGSAAVTTSAIAETAVADDSQARMPVWPFVGIGLGAAALIAVFVAGRKRKGDEA